MKSLEDLKNQAEKMTAQTELMEGRDKGEMSSMLNLPLVITDFDFLEGDNGQYAVIVFKDESKHFFFGGGVISDHLAKLEEDGFKEVIQQEGLPVRFESKKSKNNRWYTDAILFPEEQ